MNLDRVRKDIADDLAKGPDVATGERFDDVLALLGELSVRETPETELVDLLLSTVEPEMREAFFVRQGDRVRKAMAAGTQAERLDALLARERRRARLSVEQAARTLEVPTQVLDQLEQGKALARILNIPASNVRRFTDQLGITYQQFLQSLGASLPRPSGFVYAYRPRDAKDEPAFALDAETTKLIDWVRDYAAAG